MEELLDYWFDGFNPFCIKLTLGDALSCSGQGDQSENVWSLLKVPYVAEQFQIIPRLDLEEQLRRFGFEIDNCDETWELWLQILWLTACGIKEENHAS